ncbi:MAG: hypothetical protein LBT00_11020 [Spirochaetaceae bacterium]|nr:hypothetical protein [Spirochaetaceae bacterium]
MTRRGLSLRACGNIVAVGEAIQMEKAGIGTPIRPISGPRSGRHRDPAQAWSGTPLRLISTVNNVRIFVHGLP